MPTNPDARSATPSYLEERPVHIPSLEGGLAGSLGLVPSPGGVVMIANDVGSSRHRCCELELARSLRRAGFATLMVDVLGADEQADREGAARLRLDAMRLAHRISAARAWLGAQPQLGRLPVALVGEGGAGAAALIESAARPRDYAALVLRSAQPLRAGLALAHCTAPRLLLVDERDEPLFSLNQRALLEMRGAVQLLKLAGVAPREHSPCEPGDICGLIARWLGDQLCAAHQWERPAALHPCAVRPGASLDH